LKSRVGVKPLTPLWNLTPWRSLKVKTLLSGETVQLSARPGSTWVVPRANWVRWS